MKNISIFVPSLAALLLAGSALAQPTDGTVDSHVAAARAAAGLDYRNTLLNLCPLFPPPPGRGGAGRGPAPGAGLTTPRPAPDRAGWYASPYKVFDNFYWLGTRQHSSWALVTSAGIIIIDTNFAWATDPEIVEGMTKLGLNPRDIKYVFISHAHGDHDQGAAELQKRYGAKVVMGGPDWADTLKRTPDVAGGVPKQDIAVGPEGTKITLGDTTVNVVFTDRKSVV